MIHEFSTRRTFKQLERWNNLYGRAKINGGPFFEGGAAFLPLARSVSRDVDIMSEDRSCAIGPMIALTPRFKRSKRYFLNS